MFKVVFSQRAEHDLQEFIDRYEDGFVQLFEDSGPWAIDIILEQYRSAANDLHERFVDDIVLRLGRETAMGRKPSGEWLALHFYIGERLVIVYFTEDKKQKMRIVEFLHINRKPVVF